MARQEAAPVAADPPRMTRGDSAMPPAPAAAAEPAAFLCPLTHQLMLDPVVDGEVRIRLSLSFSLGIGLSASCSPSLALCCQGNTFGSLLSL